MAFDYNETLNLSKKLAKINNESILRSSISRAYYAAFHSSKAFAKLIIPGSYIREMGEDKSIHDKIKDCLINSSITIVQECGRELGRLFDFRVEADYHEDASIGKPYADGSIIVAEGIIQKLENYRP